MLPIASLKSTFSAQPGPPPSSVLGVNRRNTLAENGQSCPSNSFFKTSTVSSVDASSTTRTSSGGMVWQARASSSLPSRQCSASLKLGMITLTVTPSPASCPMAGHPRLVAVNPCNGQPLGHLSHPRTWYKQCWPRRPLPRSCAGTCSHRVGACWHRRVRPWRIHRRARSWFHRLRHRPIICHLAKGDFFSHGHSLAHLLKPAGVNIAEVGVPIGKQFFTGWFLPWRHVNHSGLQFSGVSLCTLDSPLGFVQLIDSGGTEQHPVLAVAEYAVTAQAFAHLFLGHFKAHSSTSRHLQSAPSSGEWSSKMFGSLGLPAFSQAFM